MEIIRNNIIDLARGQWINVLIPLALFIVLALVCWECTIDDAFISFRVARNFAEGEGLIYNPGERVEAHSNPLWIAILSVCSFSGLNIVTASKFIGVICGAITILVVLLFCKKTIRMSNSATLVTLCYMATNISFVYYSISGMETVLYMAYLAIMIYLLAEKRAIMAGIVCSALVLTRPEGILFIIPLALGCHLNQCRLKKIMAVIMIPILAYLLLMSFRLVYYNAIFPNSYNAKIGEVSLTIGSLVSRSRDFYLYTWRSSTVHRPVLFLAFFGAVLSINRKTVTAIASIGVTAFFVWFSRGDWMAFWRFYTPVLPFLVIFWGFAFEFLRPLLSHSLRGKVALAVLLLPLLFNLYDTIKVVKAPENRYELNPAMHSKRHVEVGRYLADIGSPSDVLVVNEIGAIGYYSRMVVIDMLGLTDREIPSLLGSGDLDAYASYIMSRDPTFIMLNNRQAPEDTELHPVHAAIHDKMMETGLYRLERKFRLNRFKNLMLFIKDMDNDPQG